MTEEQLNFFTEQTHRAVNEALRRYQRRAILGFLILFVGFLFNAHNNSTQFNQLDDARQAVVDSGRAVSIDGCNRDYAEDVRIRDVFYNSRRIVKARIRTGQSPNPTADRLAIRFYNEQLRHFKLPDCRKAENIITDNPDVPVGLPKPFWPGEPTAPSSTFAPGTANIGG